MPRHRHRARWQLRLRLSATRLLIVGASLAGALALGAAHADPLTVPGEGPSGMLTWDAVPVPEAWGAAGPVRASARGEIQGQVALDVRLSADGDAWSPWAEASGAQAGARYAQVRAILTNVAEAEMDDGRARLAAVSLAFEPAPGAEQVAADVATGAPTVRLWATREGLVGGRTANGHRITEKDHFVALPSRKVLARDGGTEYQVRLSYRGRTVTAPVWDVGPWNTRDNYWDLPADRETFKDLPRFVPQVLAAWRDGYNAGRDQFGRWVTYPASIDLADGTFLDDLGLRAADWLDVTFLWLNAPSLPAPAADPVVKAKPPPGGRAASPDEPPPGQRWYFAEGSTRAPFQTWLLLQNPWPEPADATLSYMLLDGTTQTQTLRLRPTSRQSIFVNQVLPDAEFSTRVSADRPIFVERAMFFRKDGHVTAGAARPERTWCFADGSTRNGDDTWLLLQNPGSTPAHVSLGFLLEGGGISRHALDVPATSRRSVYVNLLVPNSSFGGCVESDQPIVVERAGYPGPGGGTGGIVAPALSRAWYFAEGSTRGGSRTTIALANPSGEAATVDVTYLLEGGGARKTTATVPPMGKIALDPASMVPDAGFGVAVASSQPVVAERQVVFGPGAAGAHGSLGSPALASTWYLAEGSTAPPFHEYVLVANPGDAPAGMEATFMRDDGATSSKRYVVPPAARIAIDVNAEVPNAAVSVRVQADRPVVAERSLYWNDMTGGSSAAGVPWSR